MRTSVDVHNFLQDKEIQHEIFLVDTPAKTASRAAILLQLDPSEVLKSVMFFARLPLSEPARQSPAAKPMADGQGDGGQARLPARQADKQPVLVILPANKQVSYKKLKQVLGASTIRLADTRSVVDATGYVLGATPPLALQTNIRTLIDRSVMENDVVYTGGGELNAMLKLRSKDLKQATDAKVADIADSA